MDVLGQRDDGRGLFGSACRRSSGRTSTISKCSTPDTAMFGTSTGIKCGLDFFGIDQAVFSTDCPFAPVKETFESINRLELEEDDKKKFVRRKCGPSDETRYRLGFRPDHSAAGRASASRKWGITSGREQVERSGRFRERQITVGHAARPSSCSPKPSCCSGDLGRARSRASRS